MSAKKVRVLSNASPRSRTSAADRCWQERRHSNGRNAADALIRPRTSTTTLALATAVAATTAITALAFLVGYDAGSPIQVQDNHQVVRVAYPIVFPVRRPLSLPSAVELGSPGAVVEYYEANRSRIAREMEESHEDRLRALYAMHVIHVSRPYGVPEVGAEATFAGMLRASRAHCGIQSGAQMELNRALGLTGRVVRLDDGWHGLVEVRIDNRWEIFDSTTNVWVSRSAEELLRGEPRRYRALYTPIGDPDHAEARLHIAEGWNVPKLRAFLPLWGLGGTSPRRAEVVTAPGNRQGRLLPLEPVRAASSPSPSHPPHQQRADRRSADGRNVGSHESAGLSARGR